MRLIHSLIAFLLTCTLAFAQSSDIEIAIRNRAQFPQKDWWRYYYITTSHLEQRTRIWTDQALRLCFASMTPKQQVLERSIPVPISPSIQRIDLLELGWDHQAWTTLMANNPYHPLHNSLLVWGDWLLLQMTDQHEAPNYYNLVFGFPAPKTRDEALARLNVNADIKYQVGLIEGASKVNKAGSRFVRSLDLPRGYIWGTFDSIKLQSEFDPLEVPNGGMKHDGEEWIAGIYKTSAKTGQWGALQLYFLANGNGDIVDRAPVDLVEDDTRFRGLAEIRNAGSCISCHENGLNDFSKNEYRETLKSGVEFITPSYEDAQFLERFHLTDLARQVARDQEDYKTALKQIDEDDPSVIVNSYRLAIAAYDAGLTLEDGARILKMRPDELSLMLGYYAKQNVRFGARVASWPYGGKVPRKAFEQVYLTLTQYCEQWRQLGGPAK